MSENTTHASTVDVYTPEQVDPVDTDRPTLTLADLTVDQLGELHVPELRKLCTAEDLPRDGLKKALVKRLRAKKRGGDRRVIPGHTLCRFCKASARIVATKILAAHDDGSLTVRRSIRCDGKPTGKHRHRYSVKQTIGGGE